MEERLEYELIDIDFGYELPDEEPALVSEDGPKVEQAHTIEYDADGIPMGNTIEEIELRETIIIDFLEMWGKENPSRFIHNDRLDDDIYVRGISVIEAKEHSAKSYRSTRAVMLINEVLKKASPIRRVPVKDNKNQKEFEYMLIMVYKHPDIGTIKMTVGVRKSNKKIQYGITALRPGQPLVDESALVKQNKTKKRRPHK